MKLSGSKRSILTPGIDYLAWLASKHKNSTKQLPSELLAALPGQAS